MAAAMADVLPTVVMEPMVIVPGTAVGGDMVGMAGTIIGAHAGAMGYTSAPRGSRITPNPITIHPIIIRRVPRFWPTLLSTSNEVIRRNRLLRRIGGITARRRTPITPMSGSVLADGSRSRRNHRRIEAVCSQRGDSLTAAIRMTPA